MKKFIRFVVVLLLVVVAAIAILCMVEPTHIPITRTIIIKAPKEAVFEQIVNFKNWHRWSPWDRMDSTMKITYAGTDGQPGSSFSWDGNDKVGSGQMTDSAVSGTQMNFIMNIYKPMANTASGYFKLEDTAGMTKVTWELTASSPRPWNAVNAFMNMDKLLGGDFEAGLANMKEYVEAHTTPSADVAIKEVDYPAHIFQGVRSTISWADMMKFNTDNYALLQKQLGSKTTGPHTGIYFTWDTVNKNSDMAVVFPVADSTTSISGTTFIATPASKAVMAVLKGGYSSEMKYHNAITQYMHAKGQTLNYVIEEYPVSPQTEPDSNKWVTNIYYLIK